MEDFKKVIDSSLLERYIDLPFYLKNKKVEITVVPYEGRPVPPPAPAAAAKPAQTAAAKTQTPAPVKIELPSGSSSLFPEGHGSYVLPLPIFNEKLVYSTNCECPICKHKFDRLGVFESRLRRLGTDPDSRERYADIEPIYYDVVTCPNCLLSADTRLFFEVNVRYTEEVNKRLSQFKKDTPIKTGTDRDAFTIFAGYYLALTIAPAIFFDYQVKTGNLWLKLSRLYSDCKDEKMERFALEKAFDDYHHANMELRLNEAQSLQVVYTLGELNYKLGKLEDARNLFYEIKTNTFAPPVKKRQAELRMEQIKEEMDKAKG